MRVAGFANDEARIKSRRMRILVTDRGCRRRYSSPQMESPGSVAAASPLVERISVFWAYDPIVVLMFSDVRVTSWVS